MTDAAGGGEVHEKAFASLLAQHPEAAVAALGDDGFRVPLPEAVHLGGHPAIPVPEDRATLIDLVWPGETMAVITAWERACATGAAICTARMRNDPDRLLRMTFLDVRHKYGVWLAVVTDPEGELGDSGNPTALAGSLALPVGPRTATMRKAWNGVCTGIDERLTRMLGWPEEEMLGRRSLEFIHPDDHGRAVDSWMAMLSSGQTERIRLRHRRRDGEWLWTEVEHTYHGAANSDDAVVIAQISDISDEMAAHQALDRREALFRRLTEALPVGLLQLEPDGTVTYANRRLGEILGVKGAATSAAQFASVVEGSRAALDAALAEALEHGNDADLEIDVCLPGTGELRRCSVSLIALTANDGAPGAIACVTDITDSARMRDELKAKATYDVLTGCYNRASVLAYLDAVLVDRPTAAIFVDLDRFKPVNDALGHAAGDELLVKVAERLAGLLRDEDVVGRIGGDEFLLILPGVGDPGEAAAIGARVHEALHRPFEVTSGVVDIGASIGVACGPSGSTSDELVAQADAAMYVSKREGAGRPVVG